MKTAAVLLVAGFALSGQTGPTFDAASVKHIVPDYGTGAHSSGALPKQQDSTRVHYPNVNLKYVLAAAYKLEPDQIGGPAWLDDERYEILAKLPAGTSQDQVPLLLRRLLADRFRLAAHVESRPRTEYWLVTGKHSPKLLPPKDPNRAGYETGTERTTLYAANVRGLAGFLSTSLKRRVTDHTGVEGKFDIQLNVSPADLASGSVFSAVEDLGLKLEAHSSPADYLVIERMSKIPTGN